MEREIYVRRKSSPEVQEGPWTEEEFRRRVGAREVQFGDFAWRQGMTDWVLAGSLLLFLSNRARQSPSGETPPLPTADEPSEAARAGARERDLLLRMDRLPVSALPPEPGMQVLCPLSVVLSLQPALPGGRSWRRLAAEFTALFAARVRHEQAGLLPPHPARALIGDRGWGESEAGEESMMLLASEELKRRAVRIGAERLAGFSVRVEFVNDPQGPKGAAVGSIVVASALAVAERSGAAAQATGGATGASEPAGAPVDPAMVAGIERRERELEERARALDERERFLTSAEARVMAMMEEQQVREAEFEQRREDLERRAGRA